MACYENVGDISCGALRCLVGVVAMEPIPYSGTGWRRGGPVKICVYLGLLAVFGATAPRRRS